MCFQSAKRAEILTAAFAFQDTTRTEFVQLQYSQYFFAIIARCTLLMQRFFIFLTCLESASLPVSLEVEKYK